MAKHIESGVIYKKIDSGSLVNAIIEMRYYLEHGCSRAEHIEKRQERAIEFFERKSCRR